MKHRMVMNLQLFGDGDGGGAGSGGQGGGTGSGSGGQGGNAANYTYEQLEEVAQARASRAERTAIANYLRERGVSEEEITTAINDFKAKRKASQPDVAAIEKERDEARAEAAQYKNEKILVGKGVKPEDLDYVAFKVNKLVTDKKDFKTAADEFLKENPRFTGQSYRMSTGVTSGNGGTGGSGNAIENSNEQMNNLIREAFRR